VVHSVVTSIVLQVFDHFLSWAEDWFLDGQLYELGGCHVFDEEVVLSLILNHSGFSG
jgi:hypothetical protein